MRVVTSSLLAGAALAIALSSPAQAQYFYEGPQKPEVEVDLSVLNDPSQAPAAQQQRPTYPQGYQQQPLAPPPAADYGAGFPPPITAAVPATPVERAPLPPIASPYENRRVVDRIELEGANPYIGAAAPSPFSPPALIKPPKPAAENPRTVPARVFKPTAPSAIEGGLPVVVEAEPETMQSEGMEMPAINVTSDIREPVPRTGHPPARAKTSTPQQKPARKPAVLSLAPLAKPQQKPDSIATSPTSNVAKVIPAAVAAPVADLSPVMNDPADVIPPPEVKKSAEMVIDDLYTLPPRDHAPAAQENIDLAALSIDAPIPLPQDTAPPLLMPPPAPTAETVSGSIAFASADVTLDAQMHQEIDRVANMLGNNESSRLLIKGYASGTNANRATARRLSVSRALAVRAYLMDKGIKPSRVDVRGLGNESSNQSASLDRVDLVLVP